MKKSNKNSLILKGVLVVVALIVIVSLSLYFVGNKDDSDEPMSRQEQTLDIPFKKQGILNFVSGETKDTIAAIDIEVADSDELRARGLMYRKSMSENGGMIFLFDNEQMLSFWMKNTYISLDMLFINASYKIVTIHSNTTPLKEYSYASTAPAQYVVEVNAGYCKKTGIKEGDLVTFDISEKGRE